jgi:hypothetical protein
MRLAVRPLESQMSRFSLSKAKAVTRSSEEAQLQLAAISRLMLALHPADSEDVWAALIEAEKLDSPDGKWLRHDGEITFYVKFEDNEGWHLMRLLEDESEYDIVDIQPSSKSRQLISAYSDLIRQIPRNIETHDYHAVTSRQQAFLQMLLRAKNRDLFITKTTNEFLDKLRSEKSLDVVEVEKQLVNSYCSFLEIGKAAANKLVLCRLAKTKLFPNIGKIEQADLFNQILSAQPEESATLFNVANDLFENGEKLTALTNRVKSASAFYVHIFMSVPFYWAAFQIRCALVEAHPEPNSSECKLLQDERNRADERIARANASLLVNAIDSLYDSPIINVHRKKIQLEKESKDIRAARSKANQYTQVWKLYPNAWASYLMGESKTVLTQW